MNKIIQATTSLTITGPTVLIQGVREQHYIRRPLDLLRMWHVKIEAWILEQAGIGFAPVQAGLRAVK